MASKKKQDEKGGPSGATKRGGYTMQLPIEASADEIDKAAKEQAEAQMQIDERTAKLAAFVKAERAVIAVLREKLHPAASIVATGTKPGAVKVTEWLLPTNEVQIVRDDTGEVIERRKPESDDLFGKHGPIGAGDDDAEDEATVE